MIERTFPIDGGGEIEVTFQWDNGDPSVGINAGWGEDTGVLIKSGVIHTAIIFEVDDRLSPASWKISEVQVLDKTVKRWGALLLEAVRVANGIKVYDTLSALPVVCEAVEATWEQVKALEAVETAQEDIWEAQQAVDELSQTEVDPRLADSPLTRAIEALDRRLALGHELKIAYDKKYATKEPA